MSERGGAQPAKRRDAPVKGRQRRADAALKLTPGWGPWTDVPGWHGRIKVRSYVSPTLARGART